MPRWEIQLTSTAAETIRRINDRRIQQAIRDRIRQLADEGMTMVIVSHDISVADATDDAIHTAVLDGSYPRAQLDASVQNLLNLTLKFMP